MAGLADLVKRAQPALLGRGCALGATEGADWEWTSSEFRDDDGDHIDFTAVDGFCAILTAVRGAELLSLDFEGFAAGYFKLTKDQADTAGLGDSGGGIRTCAMDFYLTSGAVKVQGWSQVNSKFLIFPGV